MLIRIRTTFSGAFETDALYKITKASVIFVVLFNILEYVIFSFICFYMARPPKPLVSFVNTHVADSKALLRLPEKLRRPLRTRRMSQVEMIAICFCGAAKTTSLGIPLVEVMWANADNLTRAYIQIPVLLYTIEQVFMAHIQVDLFKWYLKRSERKAKAEAESGEGLQNGEQNDLELDSSPSPRDERNGEGLDSKKDPDPDKQSIREVQDSSKSAQPDRLSINDR